MRFDYHKDWKNISLLEIVEKVSRKVDENSNAPIRMISYGNGFILQSDKYSRNNAGQSLKNYTLLKRGEMAYNHGASKNKPYGVCYALTESEEARVPFVYHTFKFTRGLYKFWNYALNLNQIDKQLKKLVSSGARMDGLLNISYEDYTSIKINEPSLPEQQKIVEFLSKIDERIETQSKIIGNLESLIKGIRQRIFSASNFDIRNSKEHELGSFLSEYSKKNIENNLISVSVGKYGIRRRDEIYSKELSDDYSKNKVIEKDSLIIGMGSTQIDIGILSKDEKYCVSPAYTTYKISGINSDYLREYLIHLNSLLSKRYMVIGARQGKSVNKSELMQHVLLVHSIEKQLQVVDIFNAFYYKLQKEKDILSLYKKQKAYLLSNMFI